MASRGCERHRTGDGNWTAVLQKERVAEQTSPVPVPATLHKHSRPALPGARQAVGPGPVPGAATELYPFGVLGNRAGMSLV